MNKRLAFALVIYLIGLRLHSGAEGTGRLDDLLSQKKVDLLELQVRLEQRLEDSEPTKDNLRSVSAVLQELLLRVDTPFDRKAIIALKEVLDRHASAFSTRDPRLYLRLLSEAQQLGQPGYRGHDHRIFATGVALASIARGMAQRSKPDEEADWYYLAGEAQFTATKSGKKEFQEFLKVASSKDKARIGMAKERIQTIEALDRGK